MQRAKLIRALKEPDFALLLRKQLEQAKSIILKEQKHKHQLIAKLREMKLRLEALEE